MNKLDFAKPAQQSPLHAPKAHDSGPKHVAGKAEYIDDMVEPVGTLHAYLGLSERAHAQIVEMDLDAVREASGVVGVLTDADIPGVYDVSPSRQHDAAVFGTHQHAVTVNVRRMGGGFGGKETQGKLFAAVAALAAKKFNRAVKIRPDRDDDMS